MSYYLKINTTLKIKSLEELKTLLKENPLMLEQLLQDELVDYIGFDALKINALCCYKIKLDKEEETNGKTK